MLRSTLSRGCAALLFDLKYDSNQSAIFVSVIYIYGTSAQRVFTKCLLMQRQVLQQT